MEAVIAPETYLQAPIYPLFPRNFATNFVLLEELLQEFVSFGFCDLVVQVGTYVRRTIWSILSLQIRNNKLAGV